MMSVWRSVRDYWVAQRAESLAAFRILLGLTLLTSVTTGFFAYLPLACDADSPMPVNFNDDTLKRHGRISLLRGPDGIPLLGEWLPKDWQYHRDAEGHLDETKPTWLKENTENWLSPETKAAWAQWGTKPSSHYLLAGAYVACLLGLIVGFRPRLMAFFCVLLASTFFHRFWEMTNGADNLFRNGLYFLVLAPSSLTWSVDRWLETRPWSIANYQRRLLGLPPIDPDEPVYVPWWWMPWFWLMQIQLCVMYFFTGAHKCDSDYLTGDALYWVMNDLEITRWSYAQLPIPPYFLKLNTWLTLLFELGFIFLIWIGPRPRWLLAAGYAAHAAAYLWLKQSLGLPLERIDAYLLLAGLVMICLVVWLRLAGGRWSGEIHPGAAGASHRAVLLGAVALHEVLLLALAVRWLRWEGFVIWYSLTATPAGLLSVVAIGCFLAGLFSARLRWLLVFGYGAHAASLVVVRAWLGMEIGFWDAYLLAAVGGLVGMLLWLAWREGRWWGPVGVQSLAETVRSVLVILLVQHVTLLLYRVASTTLVPAPYWTMLLMISTLVWAGPSWRWVLLAGVGLHLGILLSIEVGWFSQVTLCFYALFVPGEKLSEGVRAIGAWLRGPKRALAAETP